MAKAPGPAAMPLIGHIPGFRRDVLGLLADGIRDYGDLVRFKLGPRGIFLVNHPDAIHHVLKGNARNYDKDTRSTSFLGDICGESLLTSNGEAWRRRRHCLQPAFHRRAIEGFATIMEEESAALTTRLDNAGEEIDLSSALMRTTFRVVARALFGADLPDAAVAALEEPIQKALGETFARMGSLSGRKTGAFRRALNALNAGVDSVLESKRDDSDLLALMRSARFTADEIRNESVNFLLAGHETTANALTWLFAFLATQPAEQDRCAANPDALQRALDETLRLAPPIWIIERHAIGADGIYGYEVPAGSSVVICPYTVHRHRDFWEAPERFDPERFLKPPPPTYLPFGLGSRLCIGREFALMEARIIASGLLQRFRFAPLPDAEKPVPEPAITLRVRGGLRLCLEKA